MRKRIRLAHKLVALLIITVVVSVMVPSVLLIHRGTEAITDKVHSLLLYEAAAGRRAVRNKLGEDVRRVMALYDDLRRQAVADIPSRELFEINEDLTGLACYDADGRLQWSLARNAQVAAVAANWDELRNLESYDLVAPGEGGRVANAPGRVNICVGTTPQSLQAGMVLISAAVADGDKSRTLVTQWRLSSYGQLLESMDVSARGYGILVSGDGLLLAHPGAVHFAQGEPPVWTRPGYDLNYLNLVRHALNDGETEQMHYESESRQKVVAAWQIVPQVGWAVIAQQPEKEAMAAVRRMTYEVILAGTATAIVAILLGLMIVGQIIRPLESLAVAANRVGAGDLSHPVGVSTSDEVGQLALAFNEMQVRLGEMYDKLERMVAARTRETQETSDFLNSVLDSSTEYSIIATDLRGTILSYNEGSRRIYGYDPEEIIGAPISILIPRVATESVKNREILRHVRREGTYSGETVRVRKGGRRFPVRFVMTLRYDDAGKPVGYTTISRDITEQKEMEAKLREYTENLEALVAANTRELKETNEQLMRANKLKAEFLASMSHELRTPLNAVIGFGDVLHDEIVGKLNDEQKQIVADILESGRQLLNLINDILDLSKMDAGRMILCPEDVEIGVVFDEVKTIIQGMAVRKGISLSFHQKPDNLRIRVDRVKLLQILYNLLSNAVKFTPDGGSVRVEAEAAEAETVFHIIDTGVGIPQEMHELIFEEFRQVDGRLSRQYGGTGLGLALTRKMVQLHGGTITVQSQTDRGSVFMFTIPHESPVQEENEPEPTCSQPSQPQV